MVFWLHFCVFGHINGILGHINGILGHINGILGHIDGILGEWFSPIWATHRIQGVSVTSAIRSNFVVCGSDPAATEVQIW